MWAILSALVLISLGVFTKLYLNYWKKRNVDGPSALPLVGNMTEYIQGKKHYGLVYHRIYSEYANARYVGIFKFTAPTLLLRDLDVVHDVMVKQLPAFGQNDFFVNEEIDPLLSQSPFIQTGESWKKSRSMITPLFTPARIKQIFPVVKDVVEKLKDYIEDNIEMDLEAKELSFKFTMENVASCAFGLNGNCFSDPKNSEFFINGSNVFEPNMLFNLTTLFFPSITKIIKVPAIAPKMDQWLRCIVAKVIEQRKSGNDCPRNDFLQFLLDLEEKRPEDFDKDTIVGHCLTFLTEGTETSSITMTYLLYELANHPDIQQKVLDELNLLTNNGEIDLTAEMIGQMKYLDHVIDETLRLHPPVFSLNKICTQRTEIASQYEKVSKKLVVEPGTRIVIPIWSIMRDPNHFQNPAQFDPDRFTRDNINKMSLLGFGEGGRLCLGKSFALFQVKMAVAAIVRNYTVLLAEKMTSPPEISAKAFLLHCDSGVWLKFQKRNYPVQELMTESLMKTSKSDFYQLIK